MKRLGFWSAAFLLTAMMTGCGGSSGGGGTSSSSLGANETAASIPATIAGTYTLTFTESTAGSGIPDGTVTVFEIKTDGSMMIDSSKVLTGPVLYRGNPQEAIWFDHANNLSYALSSLTTGFNEINVAKDVYYDETGFVFYGQYKDQSSSSSSSSIATSSSSSSSSSLSSANSSSQSSAASSSAGGGTGTLTLWQRTDEPYNAYLDTIVYTTKNPGLAASSVDTWDLEEVKYLFSVFGQDPDNATFTQTSKTADKVVYICNYGNTMTYTFEKMGDVNTSAYIVNKQLREPSFTPPTGLTELAGTYHVADTALPEIFGTISAGHMSLDLTIGTDGSIHYIAKDKDDNSTVRDVMTGWDGEKDQTNTVENRIVIDKTSEYQSRIWIAKVNSWFEFHVYMPLRVPGVGNYTTDIQWNVPYNP